MAISQAPLSLPTFLFLLFDQLGHIFDRRRVWISDRISQSFSLDLKIFAIPFIEAARKKSRTADLFVIVGYL
jgi:hypothetical protein